MNDSELFLLCAVGGALKMRSEKASEAAMQNLIPHIPFLGDGCLERIYSDITDSGIRDMAWDDILDRIDEELVIRRQLRDRLKADGTKG